MKQIQAVNHTQYDIYAFLRLYFAVEGCIEKAILRCAKWQQPGTMSEEDQKKMTEKSSYDKWYAREKR